MSPITTRNHFSNKELLRCDYLVVGAGTVGMSFVDTMLTENSSATIIIVDKNDAPGGHWNKAYPFVKLHQPSCFYGVNSRTLGKRLDSKGREIFDLDDRATGAEVLEYYQKVRETFEATGRVRFFFDSEYKFDQASGTHTILRPNEKTQLGVTCRKVVTINTDVIAPSMRKPYISVEKNVSFVPINDIPSRAESGKYRKYIVFGNGKTGADAIIHLVMNQKVDPSNITWILGRNPWYIIRDGWKDLYGVLPNISERMLNATSAEELMLAYERDGYLVRLQPDGPTPTIFHAAAVDLKELEAIRTVRNVVRLGRATSIDSHTIHLEKGSLEFSPEDTLLVDCMCNNLLGYAFSEDFTIFEPGRINLGPYLGFINISFSGAVLAFLENTLKDDDASKNDCCYFLRDEHMDSPERMIGEFYMETKYSEALMKIKGGTKFLLGSRLNLSCPTHHKGGMLRLIWNLYGPNKMYKFGAKLSKKIESKGYSGFDHCFGVEKKLLEKRSQKKKSRRLRKFNVSRRTTPVASNGA